MSNQGQSESKHQGSEQSAKPSRVDVSKQMFDYFKHLTTLSTGSILLLVAFVERLFLNPEWKALIAFSLVCFIVSILASLTAMLMAVSFTRAHHKPTELELDVWEYSAIGALATFVIGLGLLVVFAIKNFY